MAESYLLPQLWFQSQAGARSHEPAVTHKPLVQVVRADALYEEVRLAADLLVVWYHECQ